MLDNCTANSTIKKNPARSARGSLIKNPGGGSADRRIYEGQGQMLELVSYRRRRPASVRSRFLRGSYHAVYQGLFLSPHTTMQVCHGGAGVARV
jgi:cystathionine beta-lyase family protein involved in aluminum resistance